MSDFVMVVVTAILVAVAMGAVGFYFHSAMMKEKDASYRHASEEIAGLRSNESRLSGELGEVRAQLAVAESKLQEAGAQAGANEEHRRLLVDAFKATGNAMLLDIAKRAQSEAQSSINNVITPFTDSFAKDTRNLKELVERVTKDFSAKTDVVSSQTASATDVARRAIDEAVGLAKMLRGDVQKRGSWGEIQLERVLEASGLEKGVNYQLQVPVQNEKKNLKADCLFCYPGNKRMVIDAKVSLIAYDQWLKSEKHDEREAARGELVKAVKRQVQDLADKQYPKAYCAQGFDTAECVIMFIPNEAALGVAMQDSDLWQFAVQRKVIFAGPSTLLLMANSLYQVWQYARQDNNISEIMKVASGILGKMESFIAATDKIGSSLQKAQDSYTEATGALFASKQGNLKQKCRKLTDLGVRRATRGQASKLSNGHITPGEVPEAIELSPEE